jgi:hypothetical protein
MSFQIFQLQLSRINLDPVLEIRGAPRPQGSAFGDTIFGSNGKKKSPEMLFFHVFPGTSRE